MALFFAVGWIGYATAKSRYMLAIQSVCAVVDVAIIVLGSHYPEGDWHEWALQSWLRRSAFLYLVAYVAASALTFSGSRTMPSLTAEVSQYSRVRGAGRGAAGNST